MYFEHHLEKIAYQYYFVKHLDEFMDYILNEDFPDSSEVQAIFKQTQLFHKLSFNQNDSQKVAEKKQLFAQAFSDVINSAGLAIQAVILKGIDDIFTSTPIDKIPETLVDYFFLGVYLKDIEVVMPVDDNPIDKVYSSIVNGNLEDKYLVAMDNLQKFFQDFVDATIKQFKKVRVSFANMHQENYQLLYNWINKIIDLPAVMEKIDKEINEEEDQKQSNNNFKKEEVNVRVQKRGEAKPQNRQKGKYLSVEDAIEKNFEGLIGLKDVRRVVLRKGKLIQKIPNKTVDCNFRIVGNPGVGKTTVARAMSGTFFDAGIIKNKEFVELNGAGLKAEYVGQTVGKVKKIFQEATGGTIFLDEVYSLLSSSGNEDSFTQEAITQLMVEVENIYHKQSENPDLRTLIIMAGYKDKLDTLLNKNVGFRRRFPSVIDIKDYSEEELLEIFDLLMKKDGFEITKEANEIIKKIIATNKAKPNFSNAGFVRNLLQMTEEYQAERTDVSDLTIGVEDVLEVEKNLDDAPPERKLGFGD